MADRNLLFLSPYTPSLAGTGPAQRAYHSLRALGEAWRVHLLVVEFKPRTGIPPVVPDVPVAKVRGRPWQDPELLGRLALQTVAPALFGRLLGVPSEWRWVSRGLIAAAAERFRHVSFDAIHVFRLYAAPFAASYRAANPAARIQIDLDEVESLTRRRLAALLFENGEMRAANRWLADAKTWERIERETLPSCHRVFVASERERHRLRELLPAVRARVVPNVVNSAPANRPSPRGPNRPFVFLFVGNLAFYPNADAVTHFGESVLPHIRRGAGCDVRFDVVGPGAGRDSRRRWNRIGGLRHVGPVDILDGCYAEADAAVIPVRAGGGTRIKILEAFARSVPVVATPAGIEGIDAVPGVHALVAEAPADLAAACLQLIADPALGQRLAVTAEEFCELRHRPEAMKKVLLAD